MANKSTGSPSPSGQSQHRISPNRWLIQAQDFPKPLANQGTGSPKPLTNQGTGSSQTIGQSQHISLCWPIRAQDPPKPLANQGTGSLKISGQSEHLTLRWPIRAHHPPTPPANQLPCPSANQGSGACPHLSRLRGTRKGGGGSPSICRGRGGGAGWGLSGGPPRPPSLTRGSCRAEGERAQSGTPKTGGEPQKWGEKPKNGAQK